MKPVTRSIRSRPLLAVTIISSLFSALLVYCAWPFSRNGIQKYNDLIVGEITFSDSYKSGDYFLSYLAVVVFFLCWFLLLVLARRWLRETDCEEPPDSQGVAMPWPVLWGCASCAAGLLLVRRQIGVLEVALLALIVLAGLCRVYGIVRHKDSAPLAANLIWLALTTLLALFSLLGIAALATFLFPATTFLSGSIGSMIPLAGLVIVGLLLTCLKLPQAARLGVTRWVQLGVPLLILVGFTRIFRQGAAITANEIPLTTMLCALLIGLAGVCMNAVLIRRTVTLSSPESLDQAILRPTVIAITAFLAFKTPEYLSFDYFHVGESLITWQQIAELGKFPYSGYAIQRGFIDMLPGLLNRLFFDGTYASYNSAFALWWLLGGGVTAWLICRLVGNGWGLAMVLCLAPLGIFKLWLYLPIVMILAHPGLLAKPLRWLLAWFYCSLVYCLFQHTNGIALTLGTMPVAAWLLIGAFKHGELQNAWQGHRRRLLAGIGACLLTLLLVSPVLKEWVVFILEQGGANEIANGIVLGQRVAVADWFRWKSPLVWELFRSGGWLAGLFILWHLFAGEWFSSEKRWRPTPVALICLAGIVSAVVFIPYSMGRIDPKGLSRPGSIMQLLLGCLVPLALILAPRIRQKTVLFVSVGLLLGIVSASEYSDFRLLPARAVAALEVPPQAVRVDGVRSGLPNLGSPFIPADKLQDLLTVKQVMDAVLQEGETYLDLTNNMAFYPLLGKEVPSVYAGYYIATSHKIQQRMIAALASNPPPLVWVAPARTFGTGSAALRSYRLYRWVMNNGYLPFSYNGAQFLVRKDRYARLHLPKASMTEQLHDLAAAFPDHDLGQLPGAWGNSYSRLEKRFVAAPFPRAETVLTTGVLEVPETGLLLPARRFTISLKEPLAGGDWDFMALTINSQRPDTLPLKVKIGWNAPGMQSVDGYSVTLLAGKGAPLLIPLGASPTWLLSPIETVTVEIADLGGGTDCTFSPPTLLRLKE